MQETWVQSLGGEMATHSRILAWRIPRTEEPGGLQSRGRIGSDMTERLSDCSRTKCKGSTKIINRSTHEETAITGNRRKVQRDHEIPEDKTGHQGQASEFLA